MPKASPHPSHEELCAYSHGNLPEEQATVIDQHISECKPCCETIVGLSADDTFMNLLQDAKQVSIDPTLDHEGVSAAALSDGQVPQPLEEHSRYEIAGLIGRGGMGRVYKARHRMMDRTVALKVIHREWVRKQEAIDRFRREVKTAASLDHANIVTAHDAEQAGDLHFLVMEFVDGVDLAQMVGSGGRLPVAEACDYVSQAATGLQYAHEQGMVHRDIKPHNLMVTRDKVVKILDFGLASLAPQPSSPEGVAAVIDSNSDGQLTVAGSIMGTPDFISPEQADDARQADARSDIYSLGMTFYFLLAGRPPFENGSAMDKLKHHVGSEPTSIDSLRDDLPAGLNDVLKRMIAKDPSDRYQTHADVVAALDRCLHDSSAAAQEDASSSGIWTPRTIATCGAAAFSFILIAALIVSGLKESVGDKLAMMKAPAESQLPKPAPANTVAAGLYTVDAEALDGKSAAICDIGNCRVALLGQDTTDTRRCVDRVYLSVAGTGPKTQAVWTPDAINGNGSKTPYFISEYADGVATCRFHQFRFELTDKLIRYGNMSHVRNDLDAAGLLIMVDVVTGAIQTQTMTPESDRVTLPGMSVAGSLALSKPGLGSKPEDSNASSSAATSEAKTMSADSIVRRLIEVHGDLNQKLQMMLSEAAGISNGQWDAFARSPTASSDSIKGEPLSLVLLKLNPLKESVRNMKALTDFQLIGGTPKPRTLSSAMSGSRSLGYYSMLQPEYMHGFGYEVAAGDITKAMLKGKVRFIAPGVYAGNVEFLVAVNNDTDMEVVEFKLPNYGILVSRGADGLWASQKIPVPVDDQGPSFRYDLQQVPAGVSIATGVRPSLLHQESRYEPIRNALMQNPTWSLLCNEDVVQYLSLQLPEMAGTRAHTVTVVTLGEGSAFDFACRKFSQGVTPPLQKSKSPFTMYQTDDDDYEFRIVNDSTIVYGTTRALEIHLQLLSRPFVPRFQFARASLKHGPALAIVNTKASAWGTSDIDRALPYLKEHSEYITVSISDEKEPAIHVSAHTSVATNQPLVTKAMKALPGYVSMIVTALNDSSIANGMPGAMDAATIGTITKTLDDSNVREPSNKETLLTIPLAKAESVVIGKLASLLSNAGADASNHAYSMNNLRKISIAFQLYASEHAAFPSVKTRVPGAKHPVSWRVALLPYLAEDDLYARYNFDEPWDSESNLKLLDQMPSVFRHPSQDKEATTTSYVGFSGEATATGDGAADIRFPEDFEDDASKTVLIAEHQSKIPWTKPEDIAFTKDQPPQAIGGLTSDGWNAAFVDGSVQFIPDSTSERAVKALITRSGGELLELEGGEFAVSGTVASSGSKLEK